MIKPFSKSYRLAGAAILGIFILLCLLFAAAQTKWAKQQIHDAIISMGKEQGLEITIGSIEGRIPFTWEILDVRINKPSLFLIEIQEIKARLAFFPFMRKELSISYCRLMGTSASFTHHTQSMSPSILFSESIKKRFQDFLNSLSLPYSFSIGSLGIPNLKLFNVINQETAFLEIQGNLKLKKQARDFLLNLKLNSLSAKDSRLEFFLKGNKRTSWIESALTFNLKSTKDLAAFIPLPFETKMLLTTNLKGPWSNWSNWIFSTQTINVLPLSGYLNAHFASLEIPNIDILNQKWNIESDFSLFADRKIHIGNLICSSELLRLYFQGYLSSQGMLENASLTFSAPSISPLNPYLFLPMEGSLSGQAQLNHSTILLNLTGKKLSVENQFYDTASFEVKAKQIEGEWKGHSAFSAQNPTLPLKWESDFTFDAGNILDIQEIQLIAPATQISGNLKYQLAQHALDGVLFAQASPLSSWQQVIKDPALDGELGAEIYFFSEPLKQEKVIQNVSINVIIKNLQRRNLLIHEIYSTGKFLDVFGSLKGHFSLDVERIYTPHAFLSYLQLNGSSKKTDWLFDFSTKGLWKSRFEIQNRGRVNLENKKIEISIEELSGTIFDKPLKLEQSAWIAWKPDYFALDHFNLLYGEGRLSSNLLFTPQEAKGTLQAEHFPLELISCVLPQLSLQGNASWQSSFLGSKENLQGNLSVVLEQARLFPSEKMNPLTAKGSLQAHLDKGRIQVHAHFVSPKEQFFDLTATWPLIHQLYPFQLRLDRHHPLSAELTVEGKLEEIFDFINIGSHRATGWVSSHLLLSKTFSKPALNGTLELQEGTYENYYSGTILKQIDAQLEAENDLIKLVHLEAKDEHKGKGSAEGKLLLNPHKYFPYSVHVDLHQLNAIKSDLINSQFTGPLEIQGDSQKALAKGSLKISNAIIQIPDELPVDVPTLPISFINEPLHLKLSPILQPHSFPFHFDLQLDAPEKIFVKGKGLNSEWQGHVHLSGATTSLAATGELSLIKGEFIFSGKSFSLMQGEISFSDKPHQSAYLSLSGTLSLNDTQITAYLRGPLTAPQLTFQSVPHLPTSSILSLILFNRDISTISAFEAIQLANVIMSLSGGASPDVLEAIRKSLGVDRLLITSSQTDPEKISIQIGKYLTKGILISLSQGTDSSQVIVEVELPKGFTLQAETQDIETGKFTLKWNRNY